MSILRIRKAAIPWLVVILLLVAGIWQWHRQTLISDAEVIELFYRERLSLERLHEMAHDDNLEDTITLDYVRGKKLLPERVEEYRRIMRKAGLVGFNMGTLRDYFVVDSTSTAFGGGDKGIAFYYQQPELPILSSLDESCLPAAGPDAETCSAVRHIEGNWWILAGDSR